MRKKLDGTSVAKIGKSRKNIFSKLFRSEKTYINVLALGIVLFIVFSLVVPKFFNLVNMFNLARRSSVNIIIAVGMTILLLCGQFDLSVPGNISLTAMIMAMKDLTERKLAGEIIFAGVVEEEASSLGIKNLIKKGISANYAIFGEPSGVDNITIGYKGSLNLKIHCETKSGHSSAPWLFENAIEKAYELWELIKNFHHPEENLESRFYSLTYCLIRICGGNSVNITPSNCEFIVNIRIPPQFTSAQVFDSIKKIVNTFKKRNKDTRVNISLEGEVNPFETDKNSILVRSFSWAIRKIRKSRVTLLKKTGTADINELSLSIKKPMIAYGPGNSHLDHTPNEHVIIDDYLDSISIYREAVIRLFELYNREKS